MFVIEEQASFDNSLNASFSFKQITMKMLIDMLLPIHSTNETLKAMSENKTENILKYSFRILTLSHEKPSIYKKAAEVWETGVISSSNNPPVPKSSVMT